MVRKKLASLIVLFLVLSFVACGNQSISDGENETNEQTEGPTSGTEDLVTNEDDAEPDETTDITSDIENPELNTGLTETDESGDTTSNTENPESSQDNTEPNEPVDNSVDTENVEITFDTSWAGSEYVMPIPEPPISDFNINEFVGRAGGNAIQISSKNTQNLTRDDIVAYRQSLENLGFINSIYEKDFDSAHGYEFSAQNENNEFVYISYDGEYFILILEFPKVNSDQVQSSTEENKSTELQLGTQFPKIPDGHWVEKDKTTDTHCYLYTEKIDYSKIVEFCDMLITEGYSIVEDAEPYRANISRKYNNDAGHMVYVRYEGTEDSGFCYLTINLAN